VAQFVFGPDPLLRLGRKPATLGTGGGSAGIEPPPGSAALWWDFIDQSRMSLTGDLIDSATDKIGGVVATAAGASRPQFLPTTKPGNGPGARTRFAGGQVLTIPSTVSFNRQSLSVFAVTRRSVKPDGGSGGRMALFAADATTLRQALYTWDADELRTWNSTSTAIQTAIRVPHGTTVDWLTSGGSSYQAGSGGSVFTSGTALAADTRLGGRIGMWTGTSFPLTGDYLALVIYNRQLSQAEREAVIDWAQTAYGASIRAAATIIGFSGDSITEGIQQSNPQLNPHARDFSFPAQIEQISGASFAYWNLGLGGQALANNLDVTQIAARLNGRPSATRKIVFGLWGTNDVGGGLTGAQISAHLDTWISNLRAAIPSVIVGHGTLIPRSGLSGPQATARSDFNDYVMARNAFSGGGPNLDFRIDTAAISGLSNPADLTKFVDGLHPTSSGYADLAAGIWNGGLFGQVV
jgi:lysophospholipase L1-like esterase